MRNRNRLLKRSLVHYWRTNLAVVAGVAAAVAVLAGALLVGKSVRGSLRELVLRRLGNTDTVITSMGLFRERLAESFPSSCPLLVFEGIAIHQSSGRTASRVQVYAVDDRFWRFHGQSRTLGDREMLLSEALARELAPASGDALLLRLEQPSDVPKESLHGRKEEAGRVVRFSHGGVLAAGQLGEFSLRPQQGVVRAIFVPLERVQRELEQAGRVNTILLSGASAAESALRRSFALEDLGIRIRTFENLGELQVETSAAVLDDKVAEAARQAAASMSMETRPVLTYLANRIQSGGRMIPYSLVAALELDRVARVPPGVRDPIVLNDWAARDLNVRPGEPVTLEYYYWEPDGRLVTRSAEFHLAAVVPIQGLAADRHLAPDYPGITEADSIDNWDPPFPMDLGLIRDRDEQYWDRYRTTPKGFIPLAAGQQLWQSRFGKLTSLRLIPKDDPRRAAQAYREKLRAALDPLQMGFTVFPARQQGLAASRGATDFGEYFVYFSFFLMVSALLLTGLFFRLGIEQRLREIGLLKAVGFPPAEVRRLFLAEGAVLSVAGSFLGLAGALAYAGLIMYGLRTWWVDAVGTTLLELKISPVSLAAGALGGIVTALLVIAGTLRGLRHAAARDLMSGNAKAVAGDRRAGASRRVALAGAVAVCAALALVLASSLDFVVPVAGFFGAGTLLLVAFLCFQRVWLGRRDRKSLRGAGIPGVSRLGFRNAAYRPGRAILSVALIASACFIIVAVDAFRRDDAATSLEPNSGSGGYPLLAESVLPLYYSPATPSGRENLNLTDVGEAGFVSFRLRPGEDASCLNLYQPKNPRIAAPPADFLRAGRFAFQSSVGDAANPWLLLEKELEDGVIPAIADANSMTYVLHRKLGEDFEIENPGGPPVRLRLVAALSDSIFQSELIISERNFVRLFPGQQGFRLFLIDAPVSRLPEVTASLESALIDYGFDVVSTGERLATYHRVENTYLSTFQTLGSLGLVLGTVGLAAVLLRNVLERRRELALLRAVGYRSRDLTVAVLAENAFLLASGLVFGTVSAWIAIAPAFLERGGIISIASLALLLAAVLVTGLFASLAATAAALRAPLIESLRTET